MEIKIGSDKILAFRVKLYLMKLLILKPKEFKKLFSEASLRSLCISVLYKSY